MTDMKYVVKYGTLEYFLSDHQPVYIIKKKPTDHRGLETFTGRTYRSHTYKKAKDYYLECDLSGVFTKNTMSEKWAVLKKAMLDAANQLAPMTEYLVKEDKPAWLTNEIIELQKDRDYYYAKHTRTNDPDDLNIARNLKNRANNVVKYAKQQYIKQQAVIHEKDLRKFWKNMKQLDPDETGQILSLNDDETSRVIDSQNLPEHINGFFTQIGPKMASALPDIAHADKHYKVPQNPAYMDLHTVNDEEVLKYVRKISVYKSSGMGNLNFRILKDAMLILHQEITHIINHAIIMGDVPEEWKAATVIPIPKVLNPNTASDLRPISLHPIPGRILEKVVHDQIKEFYETTIT